MIAPGSIFIVGPTASGKSNLALELAERIGGEIISADSMQVYRGLDIGTAKPTTTERRRVRHHLIDVVDLNHSFDAAQFVEMASVAEREILSRGGVPIVCGGTGLYVKALLQGLGSSPPSSRELRKVLETTPLELLLEELRQSDPTTYARIDRQNPRRVVRAIEVIRITGKPFFNQRSDWQTGSSPALPVFGISRPMTALHMRINTRVDDMFSQGLIQETQLLLANGLDRNPVAMQSIGYRQVVEHLRGERSLAHTVELIKTKTRQFAKRQMTWFRRQLPVQWLDPEDALATIIDRCAPNRP